MTGLQLQPCRLEEGVVGNLGQYWDKHLYENKKNILYEAFLFSGRFEILFNFNRDFKAMLSNN